MATPMTLHWYQLDAGVLAPTYYQQVDTTVRQLCSENSVTAPTANWYNTLTGGTNTSIWAQQVDTAVRALCVILSVTAPVELFNQRVTGQYSSKYISDLDTCIRNLCAATGGGFRFASNAVAAPNSSMTISGVTLVRQRALSVVRAAVPTIKLAFPWYIIDTSSYAEIAPSSNATLKATVEITGIGIFPLTFNNGSPTVTAVGPTIIFTDEMPASLFGLSTFNNQVIYVVQEWTVTDGQTFPLTEQSAAAFTGESFRLGGTSQYLTPGALSGGTVPGYEYRQLAVLGQHSGKAILLSGNSIAAGEGDNGKSGSVGTNGGGWMSRAASTNSLCFCKTAKSGDRAEYFKDNVTKSPLRMSMARYATHILIEHMYNDLAAGTPTATILTYLNTIYANYAAMNSSAKLYGQYLSLRTASTDQWATLVNQTVATGWALADTDYIALKAGLDAAVVATTLTGVFDIRPSTQDSVEVNKWKVNGTGNFETNDGIHCRPNGYIDVAAGLATFLNGLS